MTSDKPTKGRSYRQYEAVLDKTEKDYVDALERLLAGRPTHPDLVEKPVRITPASVALEARRSRNALYKHHRHLVARIRTAGQAPKATRRAKDRDTSLADLREKVRSLTLDKQNLASENLLLLDRVATLEREMTAAREEIDRLQVELSARQARGRLRPLSSGAPHTNEEDENA
jgi:hypothetical protein